MRSFADPPVILAAEKAAFKITGTVTAGALTLAAAQAVCTIGAGFPGPFRTAFGCLLEKCQEKLYDLVLRMSINAKTYSILTFLYGRP